MVYDISDERTIQSYIRTIVIKHGNFFFFFMLLAISSCFYSTLHHSHALISFIIQQPRKTIDKHKTTETCLIHTLCFIILGILGDVDYPSTNISLSSTTTIHYIYLPPEFTNEVTLICFRCNMHTLFK